MFADGVNLQGSAAYLVEWRPLPEMLNERVEEDWIEEERMPERYVQAHKNRHTSDTWEYGPIDIPPAPHIPHDIERSLSGVTSPSPSSASELVRSPTAPRASQAFPLSSPKLYSPPRLTFHDDISSLHDDTSEEDDELQRLIAEIKSSSASAAKVSSYPTKYHFTCSQTRSAPTKKPSSKLKIEASPSPVKLTVAGRMKPKSTSTGDVISVPAPLQTSSDTLSAERVLISKGKRKAGSLTTRSPHSTEPVAKRTKSNHSHPRKHDEFYRLDGNVIIEIDNSTRFKLHRSRLALQSKYFAELFERKDSVIDGLEMVDSHPLYTVSGVSVKDFAALLNAMDHAM
jgi:hypothetical protein